MTAPVSLLFIAMIPIDCKITNFIVMVDFVKYVRVCLGSRRV